MPPPALIKLSVVSALLPGRFPFTLKAQPSSHIQTVKVIREVCQIPASSGAALILALWFLWWVNMSTAPRRVSVFGDYRGWDCSHVFALVSSSPYVPLIEMYFHHILISQKLFNHLFGLLWPLYSGKKYLQLALEFWVSYWSLHENESHFYHWHNAIFLPVYTLVFNDTVVKRWLRSW